MFDTDQPDTDQPDTAAIIDADEDGTTETGGDQDGTDQDGPGPDGTAAVGGAEVGELVWVDPRALRLGVNVRTDAALDRHFVRDIADRGVREPIPCRRTLDGTLAVRKGSRRALAAIEAGLERVRVFIEPDPDPDTDDRAGQIDRVLDQLGENAHRTRNSDFETVRAHQVLLDLGLSAGQIARRTHTPTKRVKVTTTVARSELASAVLARYDLTLDQAAILAEFDDGTPAGVAAVKLLTVTGQKEPGQFAHVTQRLRDDRDDRALRAARIFELTTTGTRVLDPDTADDDADGQDPDSAAGAGGGSGGGLGDAVELSGLRPAGGDPSGTVLTAEGHAGCPGHGATVEVTRRWGGEPEVSTTWWCTDYQGHGHAPRWDQPTSSSRGHNGSGVAGYGGAVGGVGSGARQPGPMSDAEKAERRRVVTGNRDWDSATVVRKDWLQSILARRSAPKDAARYIADTLARGSHDVRKAMENSHPTACALLGLDTPAGWYSSTPNPITVALATAGGPRLTVITLAVLLGAAEDGTSRDSWRHPSADTRAYLAALAGWGYPLAPVEQLITTPDDTTGATETADTDTDPDGGRGDGAEEAIEEQGGNEA